MSTERNRTPLIIAGIVLVIIIGIPLLVIWLLKPGNSQWERITSADTATAVREIGVDGNTVILSEGWLESRIAQGIALMNEENPDFQFAGADLTLEENRVGILAGVTLENPLSSKRKIIRAALNLTIEAELTDDDIVIVRMDSLKIGRMPVPVKMFSRLNALKSSVNLENLSRGKNAEFNLDTMSFKAPAEDLMNEIAPGSRLEALKLSEGRLRLGLTLPPDKNRQLREYAAHFGAYSPQILSSLKDKLPNEKTAALDRVDTILTGIAETAEDEMLFPMIIEAAALFLEFRDSLNPEELEQTEMVFVDFIREHPEVMEETEAFLEAQGWTVNDENKIENT